jgi:H+/Cl- antiporter ClcA
MTAPAEPAALLRSRGYVVLLVLAGIIGAPIAAVAWGFLALVSKLQGWLYINLPKGLGFAGTPVWWPVPLLAVCGLLVALTIRYLPGTGGHSPADGLQPGAPTPIQLPGVFLAALATLSLGAVLGPEAPLIALGGGLAVCFVRLIKRDAPAQISTVLAGAGSFAAISTLLGSPLVGAFLLMEMVGVSGASLELALLPGLLAAGVGALIIVGLGSWSGLGTFSLAIPHLPHFARPNVAEFGWAIVIGLAAAFFGVAIRRLALTVRPHVQARLIPAMVVVGLAVAGLAVAFGEATGRSVSDVLFSGQSAVGPLVTHSASYTVGALVLLLACKGLGYSLSMSSFRGGPVFPSLFLGAAGGMAMSHLPGLPLVPGVAMGIGAMCAVMLRLPFTSVLLATLLIFSDGLAVMPLVIVATVVAYIGGLRLAPSWSVPGTPPPQANPEAAGGPEAAARAAGAAAARSAGAPAAHSATARSPARRD